MKTSNDARNRVIPSVTRICRSGALAAIRVKQIPRPRINFARDLNAFIIVIRDLNAFIIVIPSAARNLLLDRSTKADSSAKGLGMTEHSKK